MSEDTRKAVDALERSAASWHDLADLAAAILVQLGLGDPRVPVNESPNRDPDT